MFALAQGRGVRFFVTWAGVLLAACSEAGGPPAGSMDPADTGVVDITMEADLTDMSSAAPELGVDATSERDAAHESADAMDGGLDVGPDLSVDAGFDGGPDQGMDQGSSDMGQTVVGFGEACRNLVCEAGTFCVSIGGNRRTIPLPDFMCVYPGPARPNGPAECPPGSGRFANGIYCMPECKTDADCKVLQYICESTNKICIMNMPCDSDDECFGPGKEDVYFCNMALNRCEREPL